MNHHREHTRLLEQVATLTAELAEARAECERLRLAVGHYEDALLAECPEGGEGATFVSWNEARKALSASGRDADGDGRGK